MSCKKKVNFKLEWFYPSTEFPILGNNSAASANKSWNLSHKVIREMSADVICAMRRRGGISPANLRGLLYNAGVDDAVIDKHRLHAPMPRINNCGLDQSCIERHLILYMS